MINPQNTTCFTNFSVLGINADDDSKACLVRIYPHSVGEGIINLTQNDIIIGREEKCHIELADLSVSRQHACIHFSPSGYYIKDLDSRNATYINDEKITEYRLESGDLIRIGHTIFKFLSSYSIEKQYHEEIYAMMITDGLTKISNKRFFMEMLEREINRSQRHKRPLSLVLFDIDHFKQINDSFGHLAGDFILRDLCQRISPFIRKEEVFARYGGEEFAIILPEAKSEQAYILCKKVLKVVNSNDFIFNHLHITATISIGIVERNDNQHMSAKDLIAAADSKLYEAKHMGRNCIAV